MRLGHRRVDYAGLIEDIAAGRPWTGIACIARPLSGAPIDGFLAYLERVGLDTAVWELPVTLGTGKVDVDTLVVREAMEMLQRGWVTELCLISGDGDFWVLADACAARRVGFTVAAVTGSLSPALHTRADTLINIGPAYLGGCAAEGRYRTDIERRRASVGTWEAK